MSFNPVLYYACGSKEQEFCVCLVSACRVFFHGSFDDCKKYIDECVDDDFRLYYAHGRITVMPVSEFLDINDCDGFCACLVSASGLSGERLACGARAGTDSQTEKYGTQMSEI